MELPAGFRFHPTDEELVIHYLCRKCAALPLSASFIADIDLYKFDPWLLPGMALYGEKEWYFFSPRDRKYPNGSRPNRAAGTGYWKATGADKPIGKPKALGIKKALVFYAGKSPKGVKTNWIMHEYRLANVDRSAIKKTDQRLDDWVLCRIYNKKGRIEKWDAGMEDRKAEAFPRGHNEVVKNEPLYFDTSDSVPRCQTETSGSGHVASPEFYKEVQSEPNWSELEKALDFHFNYEMDPFENGPLGLKVQYPQDPFEEMFMYCR